MNKAASATKPAVRNGQAVTFRHHGAERHGVVIYAGILNTLVQYTAPSGRPVSAVIKTSDIVRRSK